MSDAKGIVARWGLVQNIADGLNQENRSSLATLKVVFKTDHGDFDFTVPQALDVLANDLYWDERGDWSDAYLATVESF